MISDLFTKGIKEADPEVYGTLSRELERQQNQIELIASENIASRSILNAQGSVMTNKYAEGYPGKRYYGGCEFVDQAEEIALERVKEEQIELAARRGADPTKYRWSKYLAIDFEHFLL